MDKNTVITIRDTFHAVPNKQGNNSAPVFVICDNLRVFDEQNHFLKWDDVKEILWVTMSPEFINARGYRKDAKIQTIAVAYEQIQYIGIQYTTEVLEKYMKGVIGFEDEQVDLIQKHLDPTGDQIIKSIRTKAQLEVLEEQDEWQKEQEAIDHNVVVDSNKIHNN